MKKLYNQMQGNTVSGRACGNSEGLFMYDGSMETFECIWENIWFMLDCIWSQNCRNTLLLHTVDQLVRSAKIKRCVYIQPEIRHGLDGAISDCESQGVLPRAIV